MSRKMETLRFPTNLDRAGIVARLVQVREAARTSGLTELADRLAGVEELAPAQVGAAVIGAIQLVQGKPEHESLEMQLSLIALNLKNLK